MQRSWVYAALTFLALCSACSTSTKSGISSQARQPTDPRSVPTATLPAILPSAIPAVTVTDGSVSEQLNVVPTSYTIKSGDTMAAIAQKLGVPLAQLLTYNPNINPSNLIVGQVVRVPPASTAGPGSTPGPGLSSVQGSGTPTAGASASGERSTPAAPATTGASSGAASTQSYTVKAGDTACAVAGALHVTLADLAATNGLTVAQTASLKVGQQLKVPQRQSASPGC